MYVALCVPVWAGEIDIHLDVPAREAELVPRLEHATVI